MKINFNWIAPDLMERNITCKFFICQCNGMLYIDHDDGQVGYSPVGDSGETIRSFCDRIASDMFDKLGDSELLYLAKNDESRDSWIEDKSDCYRAEINGIALTQFRNSYPTLLTDITIHNDTVAAMTKTLIEKYSN